MAAARARPLRRRRCRRRARVASQSSTMYDISSTVRCQLIGVRRSPARRHAAHTSTNSGRFRHHAARPPSPAASPRARSARTSWSARSSSSANVRSPWRRDDRRPVRRDPGPVRDRPAFGRCDEPGARDRPPPHCRPAAKSASPLRRRDRCPARATVPPAVPAGEPPRRRRPRPAGLSNEEIAGLPVISPATAKTHVSRAMIKLNARDRAQAVVFVYDTGRCGPGGPTDDEERRSVESGTARRVWQFVEPIHAVTYFAPETRGETDELGLRGGWMCYFGCRAAPLGRVARSGGDRSVLQLPPRDGEPAPFPMCGPRVPRRSRRRAGSRPQATRSSGSSATRCRAPRCGAPPSSPDRAADSCDTVGRALRRRTAGSAVRRPAPRSGRRHDAARAPRRRARRRARRGAASRRVRRSCCRARRVDRPPTGCASIGDGPRPEWSAAIGGLQERGWLAADGSVGAAGAEARDAIEADTDRLALGPFRALGDDATDELVGGLRPLAAWIMSAGTVPAPNLMGLPWPPEPPNRSDGVRQPGRAAPTGRRRAGLP